MSLNVCDFPTDCERDWDKFISIDFHIATKTSCFFFKLIRTQVILSFNWLQNWHKTPLAFYLAGGFWNTLKILICVFKTRHATQIFCKKCRNIWRRSNYCDQIKVFGFNSYSLQHPVLKNHSILWSDRILCEVYIKICIKWYNSLKKT